MSKVSVIGCICNIGSFKADSIYFDEKQFVSGVNWIAWKGMRIFLTGEKKIDTKSLNLTVSFFLQFLAHCTPEFDRFRLFHTYRAAQKHDILFRESCSNFFFSFLIFQWRRRRTFRISIVSEYKAFQEWTLSRRLQVISLIMTIARVHERYLRPGRPRRISLIFKIIIAWKYPRYMRMMNVLTMYRGGLWGRMSTESRPDSSCGS